MEESLKYGCVWKSRVERKGEEVDENQDKVDAGEKNKPVE